MSIFREKFPPVSILSVCKYVSSVCMGFSKNLKNVPWKNQNRRVFLGWRGGGVEINSLFDLESNMEL